MFCLSFPNRASDSGDLYIDFDRNQLLFPVVLLDFQVEARFNHSSPNHAYASHIASRISYHVCIMLFVHCTWLILFLFLVVLDAFRWSRAVNRRSAPYLFCLPFPIRASDSGDLYIDFDRNHLIFPVECLLCQVTALFIFFLPEHAYASHIISRISCMYCIMLLVHFP